MFSLRWDSGLLRGLGQALTAVLVAAMFVLVSPSVPQAEASGDPGWNSEIDFGLRLSSELSAPDSAVVRSGSTFTLQMWVRPDSSMSAAGEHALVTKNVDYYIAAKNGTWGYLLGGGGGAWGTFIDTGVQVQTDAWVHLGLVLSGTSHKFFVDGNLVHSGTSRITPQYLTNDLEFRDDGATAKFDGLIDEVRIWGADRSSEMSVDMHTKLTGTEQNLRAHWDFNEGSGSTVHDRVANSDLTTTTPPTWTDVKQVTSVAGGDTVITFPRTYLPGLGGWTAPSDATNMRALVVAGGGGGGFGTDDSGWRGGGGGAGGLTLSSSINLSGTVSLVVGQGGRGGFGTDQGGQTDGTSQLPTSGQDSTLGNLTLSGGGRGGSQNAGPEQGGSGGGGQMQEETAIPGADGIAGQGNQGGAGLARSSSFPNLYAAGGGGGAGGPGGAASGTTEQTSFGGAGGAGLTLNISGADQDYAWGGAGAGIAQDGVDWPSQTHISGVTPGANTGAGGGGGEHHTNSQYNANVLGGDGGSGVVIIRYTPSVDQSANFAAGGTIAGDYIGTASSVIPSGAFTAEAWIKPNLANLPTNGASVFSQGDGADTSDDRVFLWVNNDGKLIAGLGDEYYSTGDLSASVPDDSWTHLALTKDASNIPRLYVNGSLVWSASANAGTYANDFWIGDWAHDNSRDFDGEIDQVKIWSTDLDESDLAKSMHTYSTSGVSVAANLVSHYDMNDADGPLELDRSGNGNHLVRNALASDAITSSSIVETGNATNQDVYFKFNRSYLTANGGWTPIPGITRYNVLAVGGGGAGGAGNSSNHGGGGGGGGQVTQSQQTLNGATQIAVGQGGVAVATEGQRGTSGQHSSIAGVQALPGGGGGGFSQSALAEWTGGGGGTKWPSTGSVVLGAEPASGRGFAGGNGNLFYAGGGGGAGGPGFDFDAVNSSSGGVGVPVDITGASLTFGAGGGGGHAVIGSGGGGSLQGAGVGGVQVSLPGSSGEANSGAGGGGGSGGGSTTWYSGGHGGSGVVILSYSLAPDAPTSLVATQTTTHATTDLSWTAATYTGNSSITGYDIEYKPAGGSWTSHSSVASSPASVQLPQQCIAHEFRVIAKNINFSSVASATASATPVWGTFGSLTGVQISSTNSECVVTFTSTTATTWTPPSGTTTVEALLVGGGGGGGAHVGGGGGGGGVTESVVALTPNTAVNVDVGAGGAGASKLGGGAVTVAEIGELTVFGSLTAFGGGAGMSWETATPTGNFATSGGATGRAGERVALSPTVTGQGFKGGDIPGDNSTSTAQPHPTGGGGGAGGAGGNADVTNNESGDGGVGFASDITGTTIRYGGGGGGGIHGNGADSNTGVVGQGVDGGGNGDGPMRSSWTGDASGSTASGQAGTNGLGGGGGGAGADTVRDSIGGQGGSGLVVIRQLSIGTPAISAQPQDASAEPGQTETLTVAATGNGTLSYQWQSSTDGTSWTNVGTNSSAFTTGTLALSDNGIQYRVAVTNTLNNQTSVVTSSVAVISVVGVTIGTGLCETMVSSDSGATVSQTAAGGCLLEFTTPGNNMWFVPNNVSSVDALVVGGGGGGASGRGETWYGGGGGGGGGEYHKVTLPVTTSQQIPLTVGAGGTGGAFASPGSVNNGGNGQDSSFSVSGAVATGGSGGLGSTNLSTGGTGGSGGSGAGVRGSSGGKGSDGMAFQTYQRPANGGAANLTTLGGEQFCLGGGGAGGNRGAEATHFYYQAQGGDCTSAGLSSGGDGNYFNGTNYVAADAGVANTGGGGGGGSYNSGGGFAGAAGGSGLVALYYVPGAGEITLSQPNAMSYSSTANTASVTLTKTSPGSAAWTTSNQTICTVTGNDSGATVTVLIAGVCAVSVTVAASGGFSTGSAEVSFRIDKITQTAPGWDSATATVVFGSSFDLYEKLATPSGVANYSFTATGTGCAVTGVMLTVGDAGSNCTVSPTINGTDIYLPATGTALTVSVTKISQSALVLTSATSMDVDQTLTLSAAGGSGTGLLSYHVVSTGNSASCVIANSSTGVLDPSSAGSCEVYAKRASSTNYDEVTSSHVVITVNKISQNLSWVSQPQPQYVAGNTYALEATASSQLAVAYSISSGLCTLAGSTVTFTGSGDCVIEAGQAGDNSFLPAVTISQTVSVGKINQTMTFSALANVSWGSLAFSLSATASSGLNIVYSENNQTTNDACDVSANGIVTIKHVGTCAITATQAGNSAYTSVTTTRLFEVTANQAGAPFIGSVSFGDRQLNASFFTPSYLGGGTVSAYELQAHPLGGGAVVKNTGCIPQQGPNQTCSVVGLTNGVTYELKVAAITQAGLGQLSASSSEVTPAANPEAVGNLVAIEGNGTLTLQWTPPTNLGGGAFDQYRIYWKAPGGSYQANGSPGAFIGNQASTSYVITGLLNGTAYDVKVITTTAVNTAELQSNTAEVRQTPYTVPDAPAAVVAIDNDNNVVVAWQPPVFDGGNPIDQYVVEKDGTAVCTITSATTTSCEVAKPSPGNTSVIEVRAGNDAGLSAPVSTSITVAALQASNPPGVIVGGSFPGVTPGAVAPIVLGVSGSAVVTTNDVVRLLGTNLNLVEKVLIGDVEASFFVNSDGLITIRIPMEVAAGKPTITLQGAFGSAIFANLIEVSLTQVSIDTKVTIGTFLGYAAVYTKNHEGKRLSMKIGSKWRVIDPLSANYTRNLTKVGVGRTVTVMVYLDRKLVQVKQIKIQ